MITSKKIWTLAIIVLVVLISTAVAIELIEKPEVTEEKLEEAQETGEPTKIELTEIRMASIPRIFPYFPFFVAQQESIFEANGLQVMFELLETDDALNALVEGEVDYIISSPLTIRASLEETPIKSVIAFADGSPYSLVAQPGLELKDMRAISVSSPYSGIHYQGIKLIEDNSLPSTISFLGNNQTQHITALYEASVDGALLTPPYTFLLQDKGFVVLESFSNVKIMFSGLTTRNDKIENNPEEIKKITAALQSAINFIETNPQGTKDLLFEYFELDRSATNEKAVEDTYLFTKQYFSNVKAPSEETIKGAIQFAKTERFASSKDVENQPVMPEEIAKVFDFSLLEEE